MENKSNISELLSKPLWQMTGEEYYELTQFALASSQNAGRGSTPAGQKALGVHALAVKEIVHGHGVWLSERALVIAIVTIEALIAIFVILAYYYAKVKFI